MGKEKSPGGLERKEVARCLSLLLSEGDFIAALPAMKWMATEKNQLPKEVIENWQEKYRVALKCAIYILDPTRFYGI